MVDSVTRDEFKSLETRVQVLEGETTGEKRVARYILEQVRLNGDDLAAIKTRLDRVEGDVGTLKSDVGSLKFEVTQLRKDLPGIVSDAMREVLRETRG
jgi:hypothetical protein